MNMQILVDVQIVGDEVTVTAIADNQDRIITISSNLDESGFDGKPLVNWISEGPALAVYGRVRDFIKGATPADESADGES